MAEEDEVADGTDEKPEGDSAAPVADAGPKPSKLPMLILLVNTLAILGALGTFVYTRMMFQRPPITEKKERKKLKKAREEKKAVRGVQGTIEIKSMTANIRPTRLRESPENPKSEQLKLHYATISMILEIHSVEHQGKFEAIRPKFLDKLLYTLGKKTFEELNTVQGRFVFRNEVLEIANDLVKENLVSNVFFNEFIVQ